MLSTWDKNTKQGWKNREEKPTVGVSRKVTLRLHRTIIRRLGRWLITNGVLYASFRFLSVIVSVSFSLSRFVFNCLLPFISWLVSKARLHTYETTSWPNVSLGCYFILPLIKRQPPDTKRRCVYWNKCSLYIVLVFCVSLCTSVFSVCPTKT